MELYDVMRTTFACREFTPEPIPQEVLHRIIDNARFAPSGGNRQGWRIINITDSRLRETLLELSLPCATRYMLEVGAGDNPLNTIAPSSVTDEDVAAARPPLRFLDYVLSAPTLLVVTVDLSVVASTDKDLSRIGVVSGASIYPLVWNILLAARNEGYGGVMTTFAAAAEPAIQQLLGMPDHWALAAIVPLGKPRRQLTRLRRKPVAEIFCENRWGGGD